MPAPTGGSAPPHTPPASPDSPGVDRPPGDPPGPRREVHCADALAWLPAHPQPDASLLTSLPDLGELPLPLPEWRAWFIDAAAAVLRATPQGGVAIFYQTDIKHRGTWVDKAHLVHLAADRTGHALLWHKIAARKPPGTVLFGRPGYAHLVCFAAAPRPEPDALPDVFAAGTMTWTRAAGVDACSLACTYIRRHTPSRVVLDPFCGRGTALAVANALGLDAVGVDLSPRRCRAAERLTVDLSRRTAPSA